MTLSPAPSGATALTPPPEAPAAHPLLPPWIGTLLPYLVVVLGWLGLSWGNRWFVNPDGGVYAVMARRIAEGNLADAVLAYWSPLYPVLAAPFVALGVQEFVALRLVGLIAALASVPSVRRLCTRAGAGIGSANLAATAGALLLCAASVFGLYPDIVFIPLILGCLTMALTGVTLRAGLIAGGLAGLAYLAKAVALPYVGALFVLVLVLRLLSERGARRAVLRLMAGAALTLVLTAGPWIGVLTVSTGQPTISTAGEFNAKLVVPGSWGNPLSYPGLYVPPNDGFTPWERPSDLPIFVNPPTTGTDSSDVSTPTPPSRVENAVSQAKVAAGSLLRRWTPVGLLAVIGLVSCFRRPARQRTVVLGSALAGAGFAAGMALLIVIERYLWFPMLALLPAAALGLDAISGWLRPRIASSARALWLARGAATLWLTLIAVGLAPVALLHWNTDREVWRFAEQVNQSEPLSGALAGASDWERTQLLAFLTGVDYAGLADPETPLADLEGELRRVGASAIVLWPGDPTREGTPGTPPRAAPAGGDPVLERLGG